MFLVTTLSFGYKKPEDGDKGQTVFDALEDNIDRLNSHDHDNVDSARVNSYNLSRGSVAVPSTGWSASGNLFRQSVSFPAGFSTANGSDYGNAHIRFFYNGGTRDGEELFPKTEKIDATSFFLYSISSSQAYDVSFL